MLLSYFRAAFADDGKKRFYYVVYTLAFFTLSLLCFSPFFIKGVSFIWEHDGWKQHYLALFYYAKYLRGIIRHLLIDHRLVIPDFDFYIGEGTDIVNALHYYVIGDPLALLSVFVPTRYMHYFYTFLSIFRLYLAGMAFSELCFGTEQRNRIGILSGAMAYSFSSWVINCAAGHPYFNNPLIYFPLMILGIEKIIRGKKPYLFIIMAAVSAASNFYFFYMIVLLAVLYAVTRLALLYKDQLRQGVLVLLRMGVFAVIGVCIAGIILLPVLMLFLHDSRLSVSQSFQWRYPMTHYSSLPSVFTTVSSSFWLCIGVSAPAILAIFLLFVKRNRDILLKILFVISLVIILLPIGGRLLNGMSYVSNRWSWAFALLCSYILVKEWNDLLSLSVKEWTLLLLCSVILSACCMLFEYSKGLRTVLALILLAVALVVVFKRIQDPKRLVLRQVMLFMLVAVGSGSLAFWYYTPFGDNYIAKCKKNASISKERNNNEAVTIKNLSDYPYTRISGTYLNNNINILESISSTQYYWTISNPYVNRFRDAVSIREPRLFSFKGYDNRTSLLSLSAVQYFSASAGSKQNLPYGYKLINDEHKNYAVYENEYVLPLAYCYDTYFNRELWEAFNPVQRQQAQMEAAFVDGKIEGISVLESEIPDYIIPYEIEDGNEGVTKTADGFVVTEKGAQIRLNLKQVKSGAENYIGVKGLRFHPTPRYDLYFGDQSVDPANLYDETEWEKLDESTQIALKKEKFYWNPIQDVIIGLESSSGSGNEIEYLQPESAFSGGRHDFIANFGYSEESITGITITFPAEGIYYMDDLQVYCVPMGNYAEKIRKLQENTLQNIQVGTDTVAGDITLDRTKLLCLAVPFSTGWEAFIDGSKTEVYCLNERYMGILIPSGEHSVQFQYSMPYKKAGLAVSLLGIAAFAACIFIIERKNSQSGTIK